MTRYERRTSRGHPFRSSVGTSRYVRHTVPRVMEYPNVKNAHIVPRTYLANWVVDGKIAVWLVPEGRRLAYQPVENVGTRRRFYERTRPGLGTKINDVEWSLGQGEAAATPLLRSFNERWPLTTEEKVQLAELFAYQLLRGPRWKAEYEERSQRFLDEYDRQPGGQLPAASVEEQNAVLLSDSYRLVMMFSTALTATSVFASMHWTLVEFSTPLIATSDHPVVLWPGAESHAPQAIQVTQAGVMECIEIRLPLSPTRGVLMTWADKADDDDPRVRGTRDHAANFNAFTVATSDRQWFHLPGPTPPRASGKLLPLSTQLVSGYTPAAAAASQRRQCAAEIVTKKVGRDLADREIEVVTMSRPASS
jgi:hypothetical protein